MTPCPKGTTDNEKMFQNHNHPDLEAQMPLTNMSKVTATQETSQKAATITTHTNRKKVTTIFVKKVVEAKKVTSKQKVDINMSKESEPAKVAEVITKELEVTSSDEEFLEATITLERDEERKAKEKADSDNEFPQDAMELENLQVTNVKVDMAGAQEEGPHQGEEHHHDHPHQEEGAKEARRTPNLKLSPRMTRSHPGGTKEWMEGDPNQAGHGGGDLPAGGDHTHVHDLGAEEVHQYGAKGVASSPPSSISPTRSQTTRPGSPVTPGTSRARLSCTPLWRNVIFLPRKE